MILKIGKGTFDVRLSVALLAAWMRWKIWPSYTNLQRLGREIRKHEINPARDVFSETKAPPKPLFPAARARTRRRKHKPEGTL